MDGWRPPVNHVHYMAPIQNIPSICYFGIQSRSRIKQPKLQELIRKTGVIDWSDSHMQYRRTYIEPIYNRPIQDYVPWYFATHTAMQRAITSGNYYDRDTVRQYDLVFIEIDLAKALLEFKKAVVTDGNAACFPRFYEAEMGLRFLRWDLIQSTNLQDESSKIKRAAELLIPDEVPVRFLDRLVVDSKGTAGLLKDQLLRLSKCSKIENRLEIYQLAQRIEVRRDHY